METPAVAFAGWVVKASLVAAAGVMLNAADVAPVSGADRSEERRAGKEWRLGRLENVATRATAATVVVPDSVPPPGLVPMATVMLAVELVTVLLKASCPDS